MAGHTALWMPEQLYMPVCTSAVYLFSYHQSRCNPLRTELYVLLLYALLSKDM